MAAEFDFSSDAVRVAYAQDKVDQYDAMVHIDPNAGYHWERTEKNGSKVSHDLTPIEVKHLANNAAYHLSRELGSLNIIYRGIPSRGEQDHE